MLRIRQTWRVFVARSYSPALLAAKFFFRLPLLNQVCDFASSKRRESITTLPAELLDNILDYLADDKTSIATCTLVCQKWRLLAQPRLFERIVLSTENMSSAVEFQRFMLQAPNVRSGVRQITIDFPDLNDWAPDRRLATNLMGDVLELLPRPESLRIYGARMSDDRIKWSRLTNHLKNSIRTILHRPSMKHLLIDGWVLDVNQPEFNRIFETTSHSLTSISLLDISDGIWGVADIPTPPATRLPLTKLTVSNTFTKDHILIEWLSRPESIFDLQQLKTLHVVESRKDEAVSLLTSAIGESLEHLEVNISYTPKDSFLGLNDSTGLRSLSLTFGIVYPELYNSCIPWIIDTLDTVPQYNHIEELSLSLYVTHPRNTDVHVFPPPPIGRFNYERWARLGTALSKPKFSGLTRVKIQLIHHGIDARAYGAMVTQKLGDVVGPKVIWRYLRDDSPDGDGTQDVSPP